MLNGYNAVSFIFLYIVYFTASAIAITIIPRDISTFSIQLNCNFSFHLLLAGFVTVWVPFNFCSFSSYLVFCVVWNFYTVSVAGWDAGLAWLCCTATASL